jgi:hypothetical protein
VFFAWNLLLVLQVRLIAGARSALHRRIGGLGAALAAAMVVLGVASALIAAARPAGFVGVTVPPLQFLAIPMFDIALFAGFVWMAIVQRSDPQSYKRWMLLATVNLLAAANARLPGMLAYGPLAFWILTDLFIAALVVWDLRARGRLHAATVWGGLTIVVSQPLRLVVSGTAGWLAFASWATALAS